MSRGWSADRRAGSRVVGQGGAITGGLAFLPSAFFACGRGRATAAITLNALQPWLLLWSILSCSSAISKGVARTGHSQAPQLTKNPTSRGIREVGSPCSNLGFCPLQEPPKRRALASEDSRSYALGRLGPMRKTRKQDSKKNKKIATGPLQAC